MSRTTRQKKSGQTIIEAMVSISVLTVGLLGITTLLLRSFFLSRVTENDLGATYLAAEGIEIAKNLIDHDIYAGNGWATCFSSGGPSDYELDYSTTICPLPATPPSGGWKLYYDPVDHMYYDPNIDAGHSNSSVATQFSRYIVVTRSADGYESDVQSIVTWNSGTLTGQQIVLEDHFFDWHP